MTEQEYDRLERIVRLWCEAGLRAKRESRKQMEKLKNLVEARNKREEASVVFLKFAAIITGALARPLGRAHVFSGAKRAEPSLTVGLMPARLCERTSETEH